jgi:hypothetical protein
MAQGGEGADLHEKAEAVCIAHRRALAHALRQPERVGLRAVADEELGDDGVACCDRVVHRRALPTITSVHVGELGDQEFDHAHVP